MFQAKNVMSEVVITARPESTIEEVITLLLDHQVSGLPVVGEDDRLLGVITEIDVIGLVYDADIKHSVVGGIMMSSRIRSGWNSATLVSVSWPSTATCVSQSTSLKNASNNSTLASLSSAINIRFVAGISE